MPHQSTHLNQVVSLSARRIIEGHGSGGSQQAKVTASLAGRGGRYQAAESWKEEERQEPHIHRSSSSSGSAACMLASRRWLHRQLAPSRCRALRQLAASWSVPTSAPRPPSHATSSSRVLLAIHRPVALLSSTAASDSVMTRTKKSSPAALRHKRDKEQLQAKQTTSKQQQAKAVKQAEEEPPASLSGLAEPPTYSSALLLNFPFNAVTAPMTADSAAQPAVGGSDAADAADLSLQLVESAVRCVRSRLDIHLTCDDWSAVTTEALQQRLAAIYTHAANANPAIDTAVILPNTTPAHTQPPPSTLFLTYLADSHTVPGRTVQHAVPVPAGTAALLCCDYASTALSTTELRVNPSKSKKKREEAKAAKADTPKKKRRSRDEIRAETDKVAARISELVSHTDKMGGIHCPQLLKSQGSPFAQRSAAYPPLCVLLKELPEPGASEGGDGYVLGPPYHVDWLHPSELTLSGTAVQPVMRAGDGVGVVGVGGAGGGGGARLWSSVVLGGTFDHFHIGHKLLLSTAAFVCSQSLLVGVTAASMLKRKTLTELVESVSARQEAVRAFMQRIKPHVQLDVIEISTPEGPTVDMPELQCIVVSEETTKGAQSINDQRTARQLPPLTVVQLPIFHLPASTTNPARTATVDPTLKLNKLSSTAARFTTLARYLGRSNPHPWTHLPSSRLHACYTVGLTGGIASGKSNIGKVLAGLGAAVVDCDALGHECYRKGEAAYSAIVDEWGAKVVGKGGEIDRKVLGPLVFADAGEMNKLNAIVWPAIKQKVQQRLAQYSADDVVVLEAAVLMEAGWSEDKALCDEIWVAFIGREEAIRRVQRRNKVDEAEATRRVDAQLPNAHRIQRADVLLCTQWAYKQTEQLCEMAWQGLLGRVKDRAVSLAGKGVRERWEWVVRRLCRRKPPKKVKATINMIKDEEGVEEEQKEDEKEADEQDDEEDADEEEDEEEKKPSKRRKVDKSANGKEEKQDEDETDAPAPAPAPAPASVTVADSLIVKWWAMLPHSDELDAMRTLLFTLWDQQRPKLHYPDELIIAIFFHHAAFAIKQEPDPLTKPEPPTTAAQPAPSTSTFRRAQPARAKPEPVKAEQPQRVAAVAMEEGGGGGGGLVVASHSGALASCKLFGSFASDMCLPAACVDRVLNLLTMAAPPAVGVHLPATPADSVDQEVWADIVRAMR